MKAVSEIQTFGDLSPWAEPAWYSTLESPYYNDSHRRLRSWVRDYLEQNVIPFQEEWEESGEVPKEAVLDYTRVGLSLRGIPEKYRAGTWLPAGISESEWDVFHDLIVYDETGRVWNGPAAGLAGGIPIGVPPIILHGTEEQKERFLPGLFDGSVRMCLGATEPTGGSDLAGLKTTAKRTKDGQFYVVNGHKKWITGALTSSHITTAVRTGGPGRDGISILIIPTDVPGVSIRKIYNSGNNAGGSAWVSYENVKVPVENLLGTEDKGFKVLMGNFNKERFMMAVGANRKARMCLAAALSYAQDRYTFGKALFDNQIIRHKLAYIAKDIEAHWAWLEQIAYHVKISGWTDDIASRMALAKVFAGGLLERANREAQQVFGGAGYQKGGVGGEVEQISRDLRIMVVGGGSEEIIADMAVRQELALAKRKSHKL